MGHCRINDVLFVLAIEMEGYDRIVGVFGRDGCGGDNDAFVLEEDFGGMIIRRW